jgi:hypothetical protein
VDDAQRDRIEEAAMLSRAPTARQQALSAKRHADIEGLDHTAARQKRERLAGDGEWLDENERDRPW